jgi:hypothetical protein
MAVQPRRNSLTEQYGQAMNMKAMQQQMAAQEQASTDAAARKNALKTAWGPEGLDYEAAQQALVGLGDVEGAVGLRGQALKEEEAKATQQSRQLKANMEKVNAISQLLGGAKSQEEWDSGLRRIQSLGITPDDVPPTWSPEVSQRILEQSLDAKSRLQMGLEREKMANTEAYRGAQLAQGDERNEIARQRAQNAGPLAMITGADGSTTVIGGPNGIPPSSARDMVQNRGVMKEAEAEGAAVGSYMGKRYEQYLEGEKSARTEDANLSRMDQLLENVETGKFKGTTVEIKKAAKAFGIDLNSMGIADDVAPTEAARALSNEMALQLRNPAGGAGMPGAMSDADRVFLASMVPGIETTREGRKLQIYTRRKINERRILEAKEASAYRKKYGRLDDGFIEQMQQFADANPMFKSPTTTEEYSKIRSGEWYQHPDGDVRQKP